ncbi:MAG TPA: GNAT family N-acetyltransferase [Cytophagaceae bacterium]
MTGFEIKANDNSECCFQQFLYNTTPHLSFQPSDELYNLSLIDKHTGLCSARIHFFAEDSIAYSSYKAPFGSVEFASDLKEKWLFQFINEIETYCRQLNLQEIQVTSYPFCYNPLHSQLLFNGFIQAGYQVNFMDLNFHLDPKVDFSEHIHSSAKRRWKKCKQKGYKFEMLTGESLKPVYDLYVKSRSFTGIPVTMSYEKLKMYFEAFPDQYHIFAIQDGSNTIAASICINPSKAILYNFLPFDDPAYRHDSPMILLIGEIVEYCRNNNISLFDLGTASIQGKPQSSLMRFKQNLGAKLSPKPQFKKVLL